MPRKRKPTPRKKTYRKRGSGNLALYIFIAVLLFGAVYWLSKPTIKTVDEKSAEYTEHTKKKKKKHPKKKVKPSTQKNIVIEDDTQPLPSANLEENIYRALEKLNIDRSDVKKKKSDLGISIQIPIDPALLDLTFSNMIIKGEVEKSKGQFLSGQEKGGRQYLTFYDKQTRQKYVLELFYKRNEEQKATGSKALAIIVDDFGNIGGNLLNGFFKTDKAVVFAIMPGLPNSVLTMNAAEQQGRESIIHVPMEPLNYPRENPGDKAIFIQQTPSEINKRIERFVTELPSCRGINNHMGSLATADEPTMKAVMQTLKKHRMYFVDSRTNAGSIAFKTAQKHQVVAFKRDVFLDEPDLSDANLDKRVSECVSLSATKPYIVAIMHCHTAAHLNYLNRFIAKAKARGFTIVPVSKLNAYNLPSIQ